jgi:carboxylesterase type B
MSISVQLALSSSKGLFHGAIIESGIAEGYPSLEVRNNYFVLCLEIIFERGNLNFLVHA